MADEVRTASIYALGVSDGLLSAANLISGADSNSSSNDNDQPTSPHNKAKSRPTQRPVIDALKQNGPMTITQIMSWARTQGHDLLRPTVYDVLARLTKRGLVAANGARYELTPPDA